MRVEVKWHEDMWQEIKDDAMFTVHKENGRYPDSKWKSDILMSEHSPIRLLEFDWTWKPIEYWVSTEWSRHKFEKFISTQRDDRLIDETPRGKKPQEAPVTFDGFANMQNLIDAWRKRMCTCATPEARAYGESFKYELHKTHPNEANMLVPNCVYRGGCPEFADCGFWKGFVSRNTCFDLLELHARYARYNEEFYERVGKKYE